VHISNIPLRKDENLSDIYSPGDDIKVILQKIDVKTQKIGLSIKAYERKQEKEIMSQYMKDEDAPSTSSLGSFIKKDAG